MVQWVVYVHILEIQVQILSWRQVILTEVVHGFPQLLHDNAGTVPLIKP